MKLAKNIVSIVTDVIINESEAIKNLVNLITDDFQHIIETILSCKGRVVITGIGKSAIVANKIVATLNSTGTPALFMHAADAIHGDLGMIQSDDVVICISKSGNTPEIKVLVPLIKSRGTVLVGMVGKLDSYLAQQSDYVLDVTVEREACPNNLAPTTSTTATMVMGDALAVALLECRDFSSADFAKLHPGGALGKQLYLKINDVYGGNEKPIVLPSASVKEVILEISSKRLGAAAVIDNAGVLVGIITDGDLRRMLNSHDSFSNLTAVEIMTLAPQTIDADTYATAAMALMQSKNITQLIVTKENAFVGFIHIHDLLREGIV
ncbi:KpsF/GutQ family sugar-phosphate isomerase [uncultured Cytophaga sp.]|uniref:KpsF/GutQ family sugar-phosphate isomerase n=1 Tax=uncultured Cytophaga sp. TaxID=160238 RepID=UPI00263716C5|nr:KpsF/GutQ family sugar-phosphate isomerase [uncultured Cytophaga sp.]